VSRIRLNRFLAQCGLGSRRSCERLITAGRIYVNGVKADSLGTTLDPATDRVEYRGAVLKQVRELEYLAYHKPRGVVVTRTDPHETETMYDVVRRETGRDIAHLRYVGRLDRDSEGLLLLTNDGDLIHALTHPRYHVKKVYLVQTAAELAPDRLQAMVEQGVESEGVVLRAGAIRRLPLETADDRRPWYEFELYEGKKRQIRRMVAGAGGRVTRLCRVRFSCVKLDDLPAGALRPLSSREVAGLRATGFPPGARSGK